MNIRQLVLEYWQARVDEKWDVVYGYQSEEKKSSVSSQKFVSERTNKGPFRYPSYELGKLEIDGKLGWVEVSYTVRPAGFPEYPHRLVKPFLQQLCFSCCLSITMLSGLRLGIRLTYVF